MARNVARCFGLVFLLVGLLGFVSNPIIGRASYFLTNPAHDFAHLVLGGFLLGLASGGNRAAKLALYVTGAVYLLLALLGFALVGPSDDGMLLELVHINYNDNWLHAFLGVVLIVSGLATESRSRALGTTHSAAQLIGLRMRRREEAMITRWLFDERSYGARTSVSSERAGTLLTPEASWSKRPFRF